MLRTDWSQFEPVPALRCTCGVAMPLALGVASGWPSVGVFGAVGAVSVGFGSFQGAYRSRVAVMLWAAAGMAVSIVLGSLAGHSSVASTLVALLWGFASGMVRWRSGRRRRSSACSPRSARSSRRVSHPPRPKPGAGASSYSAAGLVQTLLVVLVWPLRRYPAERAAVGGDLPESRRSTRPPIPSQETTPPEPNTLLAAAAYSSVTATVCAGQPTCWLSVPWWTRLNACAPAWRRSQHSISACVPPASVERAGCLGRRRARCREC